MKKIAIIIASVSIALFIGCSSYKPCSDSYYTDDTKSIKSSNFNQETYIWEGLMFPTNRTSGIQ